MHATVNVATAATAVAGLLRSLQWLGTLQAVFLLLTLFWVEGVPQAAPPDYAGLRLPLHLLAVYLLAGYYVLVHDEPTSEDVAYLRVAGRWLIALFALILLLDVLYAVLILGPTYAVEQAVRGSNLMDHARLLNTLFLTALTFLGAATLAYLLVRMQRTLSAAAAHAHHAHHPPTIPLSTHHAARRRPIFQT